MSLPRRVRKITVFAIVAAVSVVQAQDRAADPAPGNASIRKEDLQADLSFLASDALQGRLTGTSGNELAAEFIRARFERLGLKPAASDATYFQSYQLMTNALGATNEVTGADRRQTHPVEVGRRLLPASIQRQRTRRRPARLCRLRDRLRRQTRTTITVTSTCAARLRWCSTMLPAKVVQGGLEKLCSTPRLPARSRKRWRPRRTGLRPSCL